MYRRQFNQLVAASVSTASVVPFVTTLATSFVFVETSMAQGQTLMPLGMPPSNEYITLEKSLPSTTTDGKIEVIEFFGYWCSHCNAFEPLLAQWLKKLPTNIEFKRIPVAFQSTHVILQKMHYALEAMGKLEEFHHKVFAAIHIDKQKFNDTQDAIQWANKQGVNLNAKAFSDAFNSFSTNTKANRANDISKAYGLTGIPSFGVAGRFYVGDKAPIQLLQTVEKIADFLAPKITATAMTASNSNTIKKK